MSFVQALAVDTGLVHLAHAAGAEAHAEAAISKAISRIICPESCTDDLPIPHRSRCRPSS